MIIFYKIQEITVLLSFFSLNSERKNFSTRFRTLRGHFRQLRTALRLRSPGSLLLLVDRLHRGDRSRNTHERLYIPL